MPRIKKPNQYFDISLYSGIGYGAGSPAGQTITNSGSMKPDLVWVKERNGVGWHNITDSVRGLTKVIDFNDPAVEATTNGTNITSLNSNGFTLGTDSNGDGFNRNGQTYVAYQWKAGEGTTTVNTSGTISSNVSVNTTAGFSIITYTGNGSNNATIGHGLGATPAMILIKRRDSGSTASWPVWHKTYTLNTQYLLLDTNIALTTYSTYWGTHSSSVISLGTAVGEDNTNGGTYVAYCWSEVEGYSKFGSYTGNGSTDGAFAYTGFKPKFVMIKRTNTTGSWVVFDGARNTYNVTNNTLYPDLVNAEESGVMLIDFVSNGFKLRSSAVGEINASGSTYIYAAFAESPFKYSNAR